MKKFKKTIIASVCALTGIMAAQNTVAATFELDGLEATVTVYQDADGIPSIIGSNDNDVAFVQGYMHASQRFFQMDTTRRLASGRLAELVGSAALANDIQLRTLGLRRAAVASLQAMDTDTKGWLQSYANGVNAWLANGVLPPEYGALELTSAERWSPVDSIVVGKALAFNLSFDLDIDATIALGTYQGVGAAVGFDGTALYFEDTHRSAPPDGRVSVPGFLSSIGGIGAAQVQSGTGGGQKQQVGERSFPTISADTIALAQQAHDQLVNVPMLAKTLKPRDGRGGSNWWMISGDHTDTGNAMLANDPHLGLDTPSIFAEGHLVYKSGGDSWSVSGVTVPGAPGVIQGCNDYLCWGSTVHPMDVTDVFQEEFLTNGLGLPTHTIYKGQAEPLKMIFQSYFVNNVGDETADNISRANVGYDAGGITFIVPRRNNGPILSLMGDGGLSVQYTGWGPTFELQAFRKINNASSMADFVDGLQYFDVGSQNFGYADIDGNIAYFTGAEKPIRSDLAQGAPDGGVPPWFIRNGTGAQNHEWMEVTNPQPNQALPFEILPFDEMPKLVNPDNGYIANANNDPIGVTLDNNPLNQLRPGGGIYYLNNDYASYRMGRIDREIQTMLNSGVPVTMADMKALQANNELLDAEVMMGLIGPILQGFVANHQGAPTPDVTAAQLLLDWDFSTPTGIAEGFDAGDDPLLMVEPDTAEIENSAAATIFATFRSMMIQNTIDATLSSIGLGNNLPSSRSAYNALIHHLTQFPTAKGVGASGIPFINAPGITDPDQALAAVVVGSLQQALGLLSSDEFAPAFGNSVNPLDYRWGKLHRIVFDHPLGGPFNVPNAGGFSDLADDLPGVARQGGYQAVDASSHSARADGLNEFMFGAGPARRFVGDLDATGIDGEEIIPGGQDGIVISPNYAGQLGRWLTNDYHPLTLGEAAADASKVVTHTFIPK